MVQKLTFPVKYRTNANGIFGGHIYAPEDLGLQDILIAGDKIACLGKNLSVAATSEVEKFSVVGKTVTPEFIDLHVHITGGGGECGPASRLPEINVGSTRRYCTVGIVT